jgi:7-cyano-7-deazaguanine synthase
MVQKHDEKKQAVILLSGGLDSATTLACAVHEQYFCHALTFVYGQRHECEIESAQKVVQRYEIADRHHIV